MKNRNPIHDDWETPPEILLRVSKILGTEDFFDPCPLKIPFEFDGLKEEWRDKNYCNPPYSRELKEAFIRKAHKESLKGRTTLMLLPVSTSTNIFHEIILPYGEITFLKRRIKFIGFNSKRERESQIKQDSMIACLSCLGGRDDS